MSSSLQITKQLSSGKTWEIIATVLSGGTLPLDIFVYENTGTVTLGAYQAVCSLDEYQRLQTFTGSAIVKFGNRFVKYTQAKINVDINDDVDQVITVIEDSVKALSLALSSAAATTTVINIP